MPVALPNTRVSRKLSPDLDIILNPEPLSEQQNQTYLLADSDYVWYKVSQQTSLRALCRDISWPKLWDLARDRGIQGTRSLAMILRILATPIQENTKFSLSDSELSRDSLFADHISTVHLSRPLTTSYPPPSHK